VAEDKVTEMAAKATGTWDKLEQVFENRVARSLHSLGVPTRDEVAVLARRVAEMKAEVDKLNKGAAKVTKPAAKPARNRKPLRPSRRVARRQGSSEEGRVLTTAALHAGNCASRTGTSPRPARSPSGGTWGDIFTSSDSGSMTESWAFLLSSKQ